MATIFFDERLCQVKYGVDFASSSDTTTVNTYGVLKTSHSSSISTEMEFRYERSILKNLLIDSYKTHYWTGLSWSTQDSNFVCDPKKKIRKIIESRQSPEIIVCSNDRRKPMNHTQDIREIRARQTLRMFVGENEFRRYMKNGFIAVQAKSGRIYQLFPKDHFARIFEQGKMIGKLCIYLKGDFAPTDSVITWYFMVQNNEEEFVKNGNLYKSFSQPKVRQVKKPNNLPDLTELFANLRAEAA